MPGLKSQLHYLIVVSLGKLWNFTGLQFSPSINRDYNSAYHRGLLRGPKELIYT